jgi:DNA repair ATPase RecN
MFIDQLKQRFDLVSITDHMKCTYATALSKESLDDEDFMIMPGMEVNICGEAALGNLRLHLLAILLEGSTAEHFAQIFAGTSIPPDDAGRTGQEEISGMQLKDWIDVVHGVGGICIAAHVDYDRGVRRLFRQTGREIVRQFVAEPTDGDSHEQDISESVKEYLFSVGFDAIEVAKPSDQPNYRWFSVLDGKEVSIPVTYHCDAHCIEDLDRDDRVTWIKMTTLGLKGLRDALMFPETRIRSASDLPDPPSPRLIGLEIHGSEESLFKDVRIAFAENLNCFIGPRGSGKSTLVEAIRYVFGYNATLDVLDSTNRLSERVKSMQRANLKDCLIRIVYETLSGEIRILEATFDPDEDYVTKIYSLDGTQIKTPDLELSGEYPLRLFGWSEIETLGRDPSQQRDLLDRLVPDLPAAVCDRDEFRNQLRSKRQEVEKVIGTLTQLFQQDNRLIQRYREYQEAYDKLNTEEVKEHFSALDLAEGKSRVLSRVRKNVVDLLSSIQEVDADSLQAGIDQLLGDVGKDLEDWWLADEINQLKLIGTSTEVKKHLAAAAAILQSFVSLLDKHAKLLQEQIAKIQAELRSAFSEDATLQKIMDLRANAEKRLREAKQVRESYLLAWQKLEASLDEHSKIADKIIECQDRIAGIRARKNHEIEDRLNHFLEEDMVITLKFDAGQDQRAFLQTVPAVARSIATQYKVRLLPEILAQHFHPITLARAYIKAEADKLAGCCLDSDGGKVITPEEAEKSVEANRPWSWDEHAEVMALSEDGNRLKDLLVLQEVTWDDMVSIQLNGRPVSDLSPGQRSSAMLPLIALSENSPLVIDQPEDNLDNKLVGRVLTDILAALKQHRQIIVCTHNPNIVVSGDSEQVIVLEATSDRSAEVVAEGSIDNDDIVKSVIEIMEGGEEAFRVRRKRYGL